MKAFASFITTYSLVLLIKSCSNGSMLRGNSSYIPHRPYSWQEDRTEKFLAAILSILFGDSLLDTYENIAVTIKETAIVIIRLYKKQSSCFI